MTGLHVKLILYKVTYIYLSCNISLLTCNLAKGKKYISMFFASYQKFLDRPYDWFYSGFLSSTQQTWERLQLKQIIYKPNGKE